MNCHDILIDKSIPVPLYYQLKAGILNMIQNGTLPTGAMLPREQDICQELDISRTTVRQAITELVHEGWLYRVKSKGTFVSRPKITQDFIKKLEPFDVQIARENMVPKTRLIDLKVVKATAEIANSLELIEGTRVIYMYRQRFADDEAIVTIKTYLPYTACKFIMDRDFEQESLYHMLSEREETKVCMAHRVIEAVEAVKEDAKYMNIRVGKAIQLTKTVGYNSESRPVEYSIARYRGDRNSFDVNIYVE